MAAFLEIRYAWLKKCLTKPKMVDAHHFENEKFIYPFKYSENVEWKCTAIDNKTESINIKKLQTAVYLLC